MTDEIIQSFKQRKFKKCLELMKLLKPSDDVVENFVIENCKLVCDSLILVHQLSQLVLSRWVFILSSKAVLLERVKSFLGILGINVHARGVLVVIGENDAEKIYEMQELLYLFFEKVTSVGNLSKSLPIQLKLISTFNFMFWLTFYNDIEQDMPEAEEYIELVNKGILTVLGKQVTSINNCNACEELLNNLTCFKEHILTQDYKTVLLILELVIVILIFVVNLKKTLVKNCLNVVSLFIRESKQKVYSTTSVDEFLQLKPVTLPLFKFSICRTAMLLSDIDSEVIDCLHLLESVFLFLLEDFRGSLKSLQKSVNSGVKVLWNYLVVLNSFEIGNYNLCCGFLSETSCLVVQKNFKARFHIMQGKLNSVERNHKEALREFENALALSPNCPTIYYYMGQECGRMGLIDLMVENFEKLFQALQLQAPEEDFKPNFETTLLNWVHPADEITEIEASYVLAVSHGLNESFKKSAEMFERVIQSSEEQEPIKKRRIIEMPNVLTVLHEAAITNLLVGNLVRAEQIALDAIGRYLPQKSPEKRDHRLTTLCKDVKWLQRAIEQELLEMNFDSKELPKQTFYSEDSIFFFPENVIGLLILSEIQRIQEIEDHKTTLSNVFSIFSKYLASMHKKDGKMEEEEEHLLTLVKALAGKTCVRIAAILMKEGEVSSVEKMFKRALSCNKGDKDALYNYYQLLLKAGRGREAQKLWNTFSKEKVTIDIDSVQSYSLRYFLTDKITKRELENVQQEIDSKDAKLL